MESKVVNIVNLTEREIHLIRVLIETDAIIMSNTMEKGEQISTEVLYSRLETLLKHQVSLIKTIDVNKPEVGFKK
jgi:hypothetical protein